MRLKKESKLQLAICTPETHVKYQKIKTYFQKIKMHFNHADMPLLIIV